MSKVQNEATIMARNGSGKSELLIYILSYMLLMSKYIFPEEQLIGTTEPHYLI